MRKGKTYGNRGTYRSFTAQVIIHLLRYVYRYISSVAFSPAFLPKIAGNFRHLIYKLIVGMREDLACKVPYFIEDVHYLLEVISLSYFSMAGMKSSPTATPFFRLK